MSGSSSERGECGTLTHSEKFSSEMSNVFYACSARMMLALLLLLLCCSTYAFYSTALQMSIAVQIKHSSRNVISPTILGKAAGDLVDQAAAAKKGKEQPLVLLQSVVGTRRDDGTDVVALIAPQQLRQGAEVTVDESMCVTKPKGLSIEEAAMLPYLAMTCVSALHASGITQEVRQFALRTETQTWSA
jgi:hypothetical protein